MNNALKYYKGRYLIALYIPHESMGERCVGVFDNVRELAESYWGVEGISNYQLMKVSTCVSHAWKFRKEGGYIRKDGHPLSPTILYHGRTCYIYFIDMLKDEK